MLDQRTTQRQYWVAAAVLTTAAAVVLLLVAPALIDSAYHGRSLAVLNGLITGQRSHPVGFYLGFWKKASLAALVGLVLFWPALFGVLRWAIPYTAPRLRAMGPQLGLGSMLLATASLGLMAGALEGLLVAGRHVLLHPALDFFFPERLWMSPLGSAIAFAVLGLAFWLIARPLRLAVLPIVVALGAGLACLGITKNLHLGLHPAAAALLVAGVGIQAARWSAGRGRDATQRFLRRGGAGLAVVLALFGLGLAGGRRGYEWWAYRSLPEAKAGARNVLLIILDTVRSQSLSLYGFPMPTTPELEAFGRGGVVFDHAMTAAPWTLPSHASMVTGRFPAEHGASRSTPMNKRYPTIADVLRSHGYQTAGFVANRYWLQPSSGVPRGLVHYEVDPPTFAVIEKGSWIGDQMLTWALSVHESKLLSDRKYADEVNRELLGWLDRRPAGRPFYAMLNYYDAHEPYPAPAEFRGRVGAGPIQQHFAPYGHKYSAREQQELARGYETSIAYLDDRLGRLFRELDRRKLLQNTLVIVTADHGEQFAERDPRAVGHGENMDHPVLGVPLLMVMAGEVPAGRRVDAPVSLRALPSTILDLLHLPNRVFPGLPLARLWDSRTPAGAAEPVLVQLQEPAYGGRWWSRPSEGEATEFPMASLVVGDYQYIHYHTGAEELYNYVTDPFNRENLRCAPAGATILASLRADLGQIQPPGSSKRPPLRTAMHARRTDGGPAAPDSACAAAPTRK